MFDATTGQFTGTGTNAPFTFTGQLTNSHITLHTTSPGSSYVSDLDGTVQPDRSMSGTWTDNLGQSGTWTATPVQPPPSLSANFSWSMASRFDQDARGVLQYPSVINPSTYQVNFDACSSTGTITSYIWHFADGVTQPASQCKLSHNLPLGTQPVTLTVTGGGEASAPATQQINPKDLFIVSIGDSVASGESNPDVYGQCDQPTIQVATQKATPCVIDPIWTDQYPSFNGRSDNRPCHRSTHADVPQAVVALQLRDPHVSLTLLHVACSGAVSPELFNASQSAEDLHTGDRATVPPQLQQVNQARNGRPIDALVISIGGNDIGFSDIIQDCLAGGVTGIIARGGDCGGPHGNVVKAGFSQKLARLVGNLNTLHDCVSGDSTNCPAGSAIGMDPSHVLLLGYPDSARGDDGLFCSGFPLSSDTWSFVENSLLAPLNDFLGAHANTYGWIPLGNYNAAPFSSSFLTHGYCASETWIRGFQNDPSKTNPDGQLGTYTIQGDRSGAFHPNRDGHLRMARSIVAALGNLLY